jgi:hypothetical protein
VTKKRDGDLPHLEDALALLENLWHTFIIWIISREKAGEGKMTNFIFYIATWDEEDIDKDKVFPLSIEHIIREKDEALLICVEKVTYGSFIEKEINIWFPKSAIDGGEDLHRHSRISEIYVKGWFLVKLISGQYEYER